MILRGIIKGINVEVHLITEGDKFLFSRFGSGVFGNVEVGDGICLGDLGLIILWVLR